MPSLSRFTSPASCTQQQKQRAGKDKHRVAMMREHIYSLWFLLHVVVSGEMGDGIEAQWHGIEEEFRIALGVLAKMKLERLAPDQASYRALIETAGRASCPDKAMSCPSPSCRAPLRPQALTLLSALPAISALVCVRGGWGGGGVFISRFKGGGGGEGVMISRLLGAVHLVALRCVGVWVCGCMGAGSWWKR